MKKIFTVWMALTLMASSAFATTIYCKMAQDWWKSDGAAVGAYAWKGDGDSADKNANWPGVRMTATGEADVWSVDIDLTKYEKIIFTRVNGSGDVADWGAKTKDLVLPTDGKNLFTITTSTEVWGDPGCDGEWSVLGDEPGPGPQPQPSDAYDYYLMGNIDGTGAGDITTPTDNELFECGKLTYSFPGNELDGGRGYFFVMRCDAGSKVGTGYMGTADMRDVTNATLLSQATHQGLFGKMAIVGPEVTFYLYYGNSDDELILSTEELEGKTLVGNCGGTDPGTEAVENTVVKTDARKAIIDGRLVIIRGEQMFDATGRAL